MNELRPDELEYLTSDWQQARRCSNPECEHLMILHHYRTGCVLPGCQCENE